MNQIIAIQTNNINSEARETVNARELHSFLEIGKDFSNWIKDRIESFDFTENQDFVCSPVLATEGRGGHNRKDYHLTLDMAKELSMVERNEKGKQARQYFIECERRAKNPIAALNDPAALRSLLLANVEKVIDLETKITERDKFIAITAPKAAIADQLVISDGLYNLTHAAKLLNCQPRQFNKDLNAKGWIYRMGVKGAWTGTATKIKAGYLDHKLHPFKHSDGTPDTTAQVFITVKGMARLAQIFNTDLELQEAA